MIFGKIEYLNLLPFHIFMKRYIRSSQSKAIMHYKKDVPAKINKKFLRHEVDAAFISSIHAQKFKHVGLGIIAKERVQSVLVIPSKKPQKDKASASSNILAEILEQKGEILIGDKALKYALLHNDYIDLAELWRKKYNTPFVFALLCYHKEAKKYKKLEKKFLQKKHKIPLYLLNAASAKTGIQASDILNYLELISYQLTPQAKQGLQKFYKASKQLKFR
jgi:chorismate dehydratase